MNKVSVSSKGDKLKVTVNGKTIGDVVGYTVSGKQGESIVSLDIKAEVEVAVESKVEPAKVVTPDAPKAVKP